MVTLEQLEGRTALVAESPELAAVKGALVGRSTRILNELPWIPGVKAELSRVGGLCPTDGVPLLFDPWAAGSYRCSNCGNDTTDERQTRHMARFQHLWVAEQASQLAALAVFNDDAAFASRAEALIEGYADYADFPNVDNVLGPSRLFFSTYLESIWLTDMLAAGFLLRERGLLSEGGAGILDRIADEAAALIGDFNEGLSNRQVWHDAALGAVACWFEDEDLAARAFESDTGLLSLLMHGFDDEGAWFEGENYHLFTVQGALRGLQWASVAGIDALADPELAHRLAAALRIPTASALPDGTFPARQDARFGMSLAQPMYLELWEVGLGMLEGREGADTSGLGGWLRDRYADSAPVAATLDSYLYEAGLPTPATRSRQSLSWHTLMHGLPVLAAGELPPTRGAYLTTTGLCTLRFDDRYVSLEGGPATAGHGHPDRLSLTLFQDGIHWLADPGTGSYVSRDLFWYRSTLAHNAPVLDGVSQQGGDAVVEAWADLGNGFGWVSAAWDDVRRAVVTTPDYTLDVVRLESHAARQLDLPLHLEGTLTLEGEGAPIEWGGEFVSDADSRPLINALKLSAEHEGRRLTVVMNAAGTLLSAEGPGRPGRERRRFLVRRTHGPEVLFATLFTAVTDIRDITVEGSVVTVHRADGDEVHAPSAAGWEIALGGETIALGGRFPAPVTFEPLLKRQALPRERGEALFTPDPPALDGTMTGFEDASPLQFDHEDQYRRSEEPFAGADVFGATAALKWDPEALYLAVDVTKGELLFRPRDAPPLDLDNEPADIHSDGLQVYLESGEGEAWGVLVVPEPGGGLRISPTTDSLPVSAVQASGSWRATPEGYRVTMQLAPAFWHSASLDRRVRFDLIVNEMRSGRRRRAGQLVWSGGGGWIWLRGDRQLRHQFGIIDLI